MTVEEENITARAWLLQGSIAVTVAGAGTFAQSAFALAGTPDNTGDDWLIALVVAGDASQPGIVLEVPAGVEPQAAA